MDIKNICLDIVKNHFNVSAKLYIGEIDEATTLVTLDGKCLYLIPNKSFIFDYEKILDGRDMVNRVKEKIIDPMTKISEIATLTNELKIQGKDTLIAIKNEKTTVWINKAFLKNFNCREFTFKISDPKSPVLVYESNVLVGLIYPVYIKS